MHRRRNLRTHRIRGSTYASRNIFIAGRIVAVVSRMRISCLEPAIVVVPFCLATTTKERNPSAKSCWTTTLKKEARPFKHMLSVGEQPHVLSLLKAARVKNYPAGAEVYNETDCRLEIRTVEAFNYGKWSVFAKRYLQLQYRVCWRCKPETSGRCGEKTGCKYNKTR